MSTAQKCPVFPRVSFSYWTTPCLSAAFRTLRGSSLYRQQEPMSVLNPAGKQKWKQNKTRVPNNENVTKKETFFQTNESEVSEAFVSCVTAEILKQTTSNI